MFGLGGFTSETSYFMVLWFITYILFCYCMIPILQKINIEKEKNDIKFIGKLIILLLIVFIILELISFIGLPSLSMAHVSCFIIPYYVSKRFDILSIKFNEANNKLLILILLLNIFIALMRYGFVSILPPAVIELLYLYSHTLLGVSTFYVLINIIDKVISFNNSLVNLVNISDKYSLSIYIVHSVFVGFSTSLISYFGNGIIGIIIALTVTLIISYVLTNISSKILNKVLIMM